ncbi:MAG: peptide MFS transporter [Pseudomonadales bacterium]|nr:peptide MFS transporter [Pseudomonadales bacterium]
MATASDRDILGHPRGLVVLFFAEMWERFSYYGMRALLILYLTKHFLFGDSDATGIYASYGAMVYFMPVIGGLIADRYLGFRKAVIWGAILLVCGHMGMALEGDAAVIGAQGVERNAFYLQSFYMSLAFIIVGVGFLKPSISSIVGQLYEYDDPRRDGGFTIFYMGINVGAAISAILCGWLGETYGWKYGFGLAGIGMLAGLFTFIRGQHLLQGAGMPAKPDHLQETMLGLVTREKLIYLLSFVGVLLVWQLLQHRLLIGSLLMGTSFFAVSGLVLFSLFKCSPVERDRMLIVLFLVIISVVFWSFFEQAGSSMALFIDRNIDRNIMGMEIKASMFQSLNAIFIVIMAPLFSWFWVKLAASKMEPSTPAKFGLAIVQVGLGFAALVYGISIAQVDGSVGAFWIILAFFLHTTGELCLSPIGLAMVTRLSVPRVVGLMMGVWFLASSASSYVGGLIAAGASTSESGGVALDRVAALAVYSEIFGYLAKTAVGVGLAIIILAPFIKHFMHAGKAGGVTERTGNITDDNAEVN